MGFLHGGRRGVHQIANQWLSERWAKHLTWRGDTERLLLKLTIAELESRGQETNVTLSFDEITLLAAIVAGEVVRQEKEEERDDDEEVDF